MARNNKSGFGFWYDNFEYKGHVEDYYYDIPFEKFCDAIRNYFNSKFVTIDGTDGDIYRVIYSFSGEDGLENIFEDQEARLKEELLDDAYEEYKDYIEYYYSDEE